MKKYIISQTDSMVYVYEVEAETREEAIEKVQKGEAYHILEKDFIADRFYQEEFYEV